MLAFGAMGYFDIEAIRNSCPAVTRGQEEVQIPVIETDQYEVGVGKAECRVPQEQIVEAATFGCRNVTAVSSTGCPLRDACPVKVRIPN